MRPDVNAETLSIVPSHQKSLMFSFSHCIYAILQPTAIFKINYSKEEAVALFGKKSHRFVHLLTLHETLALSPN
jgi:hypothetical protein